MASFFGFHRETPWSIRWKWEHWGTWWCAFVDESVCGFIHLAMPDLFIPSQRTDGASMNVASIRTPFVGNGMVSFFRIFASKRPHVISQPFVGPWQQHGFQPFLHSPISKFWRLTPGRANCGKCVSGRLACWVACWKAFLWLCDYWLHTLTRYNGRIWIR